MKNRVLQKKPNRLINEKSPYLLQHAYNPVDWYPWRQEAFDKAKNENKPIFLSIGYASCHWCHVMEKECFEDEEVAKLLNESFVCIKVDREERPDLDAAYMLVCQEMGRSCGWPLHILMTPRLNPFFAASYIPKTSRQGMTGIMDLVPQAMRVWKLQSSQLEIVGTDIRSRLEALQKRAPQNELEKKTLQEAYEWFSNEFDHENGGFSSAPKFPRPHNLLFLLRYWKRSGEKNALDMVEKTLRKMRLGGIFDQVGFGFHRYSTDSQWLVPHFEKMLYDQALITLAYIEAYQATGAPKFKLTAKETLEYAIRDLGSPEHAFYSAHDADTEGEEGKFYLWTMEEVVNALPPADADLAVHLFGLKAEGNYLDDFGRNNGKNILHIAEPIEEVAVYKGITLDELITRLVSITNALFEARKKRGSPARDEKILTDWNGLMVGALAKGSQVLGEQLYLSTAMKTADFILTQMCDENGMLYHRYAQDERAVEGFLDDYAFLVFGLIEIYEASFEDKYLKAASTLTKVMITRFWDDKDGGFYFTAENPQTALPRIKQVYDGAVPSGNSVALLNIIRLSRLLNEPAYEAMAIKISKTFSEEVQALPQAFTFLLMGVDFMVGPSHNVILVGNLEEKDTFEMAFALKKLYLPNLVISLRGPGKEGLGYEKIEGKATAYVCRNQTCLPPTNKISEMLKQLAT